MTASAGTPSNSALDFARVATAVYCADKLLERWKSRDHWTREIHLSVPVFEPAAWEAAASKLQNAFGFLTNDSWSFEFRQTSEEVQTTLQRLDPPDSVALFSGGMDSFISSVDHLARGQRVALISHYDNRQLRSPQLLMMNSLTSSFGEDRIFHRAFGVGPRTPDEAQFRPLSEARETTTRSRSVLFLAAAILVASAFQMDEIVIPENGFVSVNVPLEPMRAGACTTRTTHPHFLGAIGEVFEIVGVEISIENPYRFRTKAEMLMESVAPEFIAAHIRKTISCAHPGASRYDHGSFGNCGYCYPCLIRRSSLFQIDLDDPADYRVDVGRTNFTRDGGSKRDHVNAVSSMVRRESDGREVLRTGAIPREDLRDCQAVYERGKAELEAWLTAAVDDYVV